MMVKAESIAEIQRIFAPDFQTARVAIGRDWLWLEKSDLRNRPHMRFTTPTRFYAQPNVQRWYANWN
jgi:hypothetical protein